MNKKTFGILCLGLGFGLWVLERITGAISGIWVNSVCGASAHDIPGDGECGFNYDMYVVLIALLVVLVGVVLVIWSKKDQSKNE